MSLRKRSGAVEAVALDRAAQAVADVTPRPQIQLGLHSPPHATGCRSLVGGEEEEHVICPNNEMNVAGGDVQSMVHLRAGEASVGQDGVNFLAEEAGALWDAL